MRPPGNPGDAPGDSEDLRIPQEVTPSDKPSMPPL